MDEISLPLPPVRCLSKEQAAVYLGIGVTLFDQLEVPEIRLGRRRVFDRLDLDAWLDEHKGERRRAGKDNLWPEKKESTGGPIPVSGGFVQRSPTAKEYAKALGLKSERTPKRI